MSRDLAPQGRAVKLPRDIARKAARELRRGYDGDRYRWYHHTDAGRCGSCSAPKLTPVYRGIRWMPVKPGGRIGDIRQTGSLCLYHAVETIAKGFESEPA
jgi:hypothetical protein